MANTRRTAPAWDATDADGFRTAYALTHGVSQLLRSTAVQKINFMFGAVIVSGSRMLELARAIENFEVVVYQDTKCKKVPSPFDGYYSGNDDAIYLGFKDLASMDNRMLLVHECVHAINDMNGSAGLSQLDDECAGYVACAQYYRYSGNAWPKRAKATAPLVDAIYDAAFSLADDYLDKVMNPTMGVETLRAAVLAHPIYAGADTKKMTYNGLDHGLRSKAFRLLTRFS